MIRVGFKKVVVAIASMHAAHAPGPGPGGGIIGGGPERNVSHDNKPTEHRKKKPARGGPAGGDSGGAV